MEAYPINSSRLMIVAQKTFIFQEKGQFVLFTVKAQAEQGKLEAELRDAALAAKSL